MNSDCTLRVNEARFDLTIKSRCFGFAQAQWKVFLKQLPLVGLVAVQGVENQRQCGRRIGRPHQPAAFDGALSDMLRINSCLKLIFCGMFAAGNCERGWSTFRLAQSTCFVRRRRALAGVLAFQVSPAVPSASEQNILMRHAADLFELETFAGCEHAGAGVVHRFELCPGPDESDLDRLRQQRLV